jgi:hypothetical protein
VICRWLSRRLERAEQAVPHRGADAVIHDLSMVVGVMESLEPSQVGDAREVFGSMVLQVVHKGEIVVSVAICSPNLPRGTNVLAAVDGVPS